MKDYWEFDALVTVSDPRGVENLDALDAIYHWTELIQSSPLAVERSVHGAIGGAYRSQRITTLELRFNPMKRNRGGERDLDHIILAAIRGLDLRAARVPAGARRADPDDGPHVRPRGRTRSSSTRRSLGRARRRRRRHRRPAPGWRRYDYTQVEPMVETARAAGLGVTIHVGEEGSDGRARRSARCVEPLRPDRIGHGILAAATRR